MADSSSRALLAPYGDYTNYTNTLSAQAGKRTTYKLPLLICSFLALLIGCIAASIVILLTSHEDRVGSWLIRPAVLVSILAGVYVIVLGGLFTAGVAVIWWRSIGNGTTLSRLHFVYDGARPHNFFFALSAGGHARRVALASIVVVAAKLSIGPILQHSTRPETRAVTDNFDMSMYLARVIPDGFFGTGAALSYEGSEMSSAAFILKDNITAFDGAEYSCPTNGTCEAAVAGAGLNFGCTSEPKALDLLDPKSEGSTLFNISLSMDYGTGLPILYLDSTYISAVNSKCEATVTKQTCSMIPAIMWYPLSISNGNIDLNYSEILQNLTIVSNSSTKADELTEDLEARIGPLRGIQGAFARFFKSQATLRLNDGRATGYHLGENASFWADIFHRTQYSQPDFPDSVVQNCPLVWYSPTEYVMSHIINFMFRSARRVAGSEDGYKQNFTAVYRNQELQYITDFRWLGASVGVMVLGIVAAMALLWGWWQLDRYVTLSPLETGKAFGAPILIAAGPEREANSIVKEVGNERVAHDGNELVWNGSVYATGVGGSLRGGASSRETETGEISGSSAHSSQRGRGHRRGMSSISDASPVQARPSFEHSLGVTTRRPYEDEEEMDIGQYGRPRSRSRGSDTTPLIPMSPGFNSDNARSPKLPPIPPIPRMGTIRMEPLSPTGRPRRPSRSAVDARSVGRRPLSNIAERGSPTPSD